MFVHFVRFCMVPNNIFWWVQLFFFFFACFFWHNHLWILCLFVFGRSAGTYSSAQTHKFVVNLVLTITGDFFDSFCRFIPQMYRHGRKILRRPWSFWIDHCIPLTAEGRRGKHRTIHNLTRPSGRDYWSIQHLLLLLLVFFQSYLF